MKLAMPTSSGRCHGQAGASLRWMRREVGVSTVSAEVSPAKVQPSVILLANEAFTIGRQDAGPTTLIFAAVIVFFVGLVFADSATAQVNVKTLGGGPVVAGGPPNGFVNGPTLQESQFNSPAGLALDGDGFLYVADRDNGQIRKLDIAGDRCRTYLSGLNKPIAVVLDSANNIYIANQGDGTVRSFDRFGNPAAVFTGFTDLSAIALDGTTNLYVTELQGTLKRISQVGEVTLLATGLAEPRGVAVLDNGSVAVSEKHAIRLINPLTFNVTWLAGTNVPGFINGPAHVAKFNAPYQIAKAPNGSLVVADRLNHRVRVVDTNGLTSTLYGIAPSEWASDYPGWEDGEVEFVEARDPFGVIVAKDGTVYTSEVYYHLIRSVTGTGLNSTGSDGTGTGTNGTNVVTIVAPTIEPAYGYYPMGQTIVVKSPNPEVYYTLDGSEPTTNSLRLSFTNNIATLNWRETLRDLTALRLKAFSGTNASTTVGGQPSPNNEIGITRDVVAGIGSTVVVPVVMNLQSNTPLRSVQFRVEVKPNSPASPPISGQFRTLEISTNSFIRVVTSAEAGGGANYNYSAYDWNGTRGLAVSFIGTNANFSIKNFAVVAMLAVPIPPTVKEGDSYRITVLEPSGTTDGQETPVEPTPMAARNIVVRNLPYVIGDSALVGWYNAGDFGNGDLKNNDVNNAFNASFGVRVPYNFSDLFNAMDVFPEDVPGYAGGDGQIRYLDWQILLYRALRLNINPDFRTSTNNWKRFWSTGGVREPIILESLPGSAAQPAEVFSALPGQVWTRPALIGATSVEKANPDSVVEVPIYVQLLPGASLSGLQFRATVVPEGNSPAVNLPAQFVPELGVPVPRIVDGLAVNEIACAWNLGDFAPSLEGSNRLGYLHFKIPVNAPAGLAYSIQFSYADGSPDFNTQYDFESLPGGVWIQTNVPLTPPMISPEWKTNFFGKVTNPLAESLADPDGDEAPNWEEFQAGTNPTNALSRLALSVQPETAGTNGAASFKLRWLSAPGKTYVLEATQNLVNPNWIVIATDLAGTGNVLEYTDSTPNPQAQFYRVRISP